MTPPPDLPDVNVWLALSFAGHSHHAEANRYWNHERRDRIAFCGVTWVGLPRLLTTAPVMHGKPFSPSVAAAKCRGFMALPDVEFIPDSDSLMSRVEVWAGAPFFKAKLWTDAWIAALALEHGCRVVSFDTDFAKFPGLDLLLLRP